MGLVQRRRNSGEFVVKFRPTGDRDFDKGYLSAIVEISSQTTAYYDSDNDNSSYDTDNDRERRDSHILNTSNTSSGVIETIPVPVSVPVSASVSAVLVPENHVVTLPLPGTNSSTYSATSTSTSTSTSADASDGTNTNTNTNTNANSTSTNSSSSAGATDDCDYGANNNVHNSAFNSNNNAIPADGRRVAAVEGESAGSLGLLRGILIKVDHDITASGTANGNTGSIGNSGNRVSGVSGISVNRPSSPLVNSQRNST